MEQQYQGMEHRRSPRVGYVGEIWYRDINKTLQGFKHAYAKNISEHGILFETYENFPSCSILELKLDLSLLPGVLISNSTSINVLAEVVRSEEIRRSWLYHIAVSFCKINPEDRSALQSYIQKAQEAIFLKEDIRSSYLHSPK